jgi:hypothetical protein
MAIEVRELIHDRLAQLIDAHRTTLITRMAALAFPSHRPGVARLPPSKDGDIDMVRRFD